MRFAPKMNAVGGMVLKIKGIRNHEFTVIFTNNIYFIKTKSFSVNKFITFPQKKLTA